ncbi:MAG: phosphate regulon sensor histidine kinase PhoR [Pseudomonadota bacterium]
MHLKDIQRFGAILVLAIAVGLVLDALSWALLTAALIYLVWLQLQLNKLLSWVKEPKIHEPPETNGVLEEFVREVDYLRERHKKRKKKLANYLKQFQQATRALPDATVVLDEAAQVRWANEAATRDLGVRWPEDIGRRITNLIRSPEIREFVDNADSQQTIEISCPNDPERYLSVLLAPYGKSQRLFVARDVTQLHRANRIRRDFVANVSHELRTPITVFRGYLENMRNQRDVCPSEWEMPISLLSGQADRMQSLVEELLLLSRLEMEEEISATSSLAIADLICDIQARAFELSGASDHRFVMEIDPTVFIEGVGSEIDSAFSNLVFNAISYTPPKGTIILRWYADDEGAHFEVTDDGPGIEQRHLNRLTERFYRVDASRSREQGGTGLGLAIVKHVLSRHGAVLKIDSELGKGSTFACHFPAALICGPVVLEEAS